MKIAGIVGGLALALIVGALFYWSGGKTNAPNSPSPLPPSNSEPMGGVTQKTVKASIKTVKGEIQLELYPDVAPKTVANFVKLAQDKFYDGTKFHRVVPGFVIQGGDPLSKTDDPRVGSGGPGYQFEDEINPKSIGVPREVINELEAEGYRYNESLSSLPVDVGAIAMANSGPNTNGSQFFIVTDAPQPHLNGKHTVFGKVVGGMEVVRSVKQDDIIQSIGIGE